MSVSWPSTVNSKFYGMTKTVKENVITTDFESGKTRTILKNAKPTMTFSFSLLLWSKDEEIAFWSWFSDTALSGSVPFTFTNLLTFSGTKDYRITNQPEVAEGTYPKTLTIEVEEA